MRLPRPWLRSSAAAVAALVALLAARGVLERQLVTHVLVLIPGLMAAGALAIGRLGAPAALARLDPLGTASVLLAVLVLCGWMLPRSVDAALAEPWVEVARWVMLPAVGALAAAPGWRRLPALARAFVVANAWSMLLAAGWLYVTVPERLCSYYLLGEQRRLGLGCLALAALVGAASARRALTPGRVARRSRMASCALPPGAWRGPRASVPRH